LSEEEALFLGEVLAFLTTHGWRPSRGGHALCTLWESLAGRCADAATRGRMLTAALSSAETFTDAKRLRALLEKDSASS
jgi:hypothetical protein